MTEEMQFPYCVLPFILSLPFVQKDTCIISEIFSCNEFNVKTIKCIFHQVSWNILAGVTILHIHHLSFIFVWVFNGSALENLFLCWDIWRNCFSFFNNQTDINKFHLHYVKWHVFDAFYWIYIYHIKHS